jgi:hypothetical protein
MAQQEQEQGKRVQHTLVSRQELQDPANFQRLFEMLKGRPATRQEVEELNQAAAGLAAKPE